MGSLSRGVVRWKTDQPLRYQLQAADTCTKGGTRIWWNYHPTVFILNPTHRRPLIGKKNNFLPWSRWRFEPDGREEADIKIKGIWYTSYPSRPAAEQTRAHANSRNSSKQQNQKDNHAVLQRAREEPRKILWTICQGCSAEGEQWRFQRPEQPVHQHLKQRGQITLDQSLQWPTWTEALEPILELRWRNSAGESDKHGGMNIGCKIGMKKYLSWKILDWLQDKKIRGFILR